MNAFSTDLRDAALRSHDSGVALAEVARRFGVSRRTVTRWKTQRTRTGSVAPRPRPGRPPALDPQTLRWLQARVLATPDATLDDHRDALRRERAITVHRSTVSRALKSLGVTHKKRV